MHTSKMREFIENTDKKMVFGNYIKGLLKGFGGFVHSLLFVVLCKLG